jgi:H/ACA ribonucleoprotein complex subunit 3
MTKSDIRVCSAWASGNDFSPETCDADRPVYTLSSTCPECGAEAVNSAPAPFDPADPYGEYRRRARPDGPDA